MAVQTGAGTWTRLSWHLVWRAVSCGVVLGLMFMGSTLERAAAWPRSASTTATAGLVQGGPIGLERSTAGRAKVKVPVLRWRACGTRFQCATAKVPLDYDHPRGRQISLALLRLPATDRRHRIGSLFINPGGPGGSGREAVRQGAEAWSAQVRSRFDLVGMDPRGMGGSSPLRCFATSGESARVGLRLRTAPNNRAEFRRLTKLARAVAHRCAARNGALLRHMSTANIARDLNLLRRAVGDKLLTYDGISWGTYLGATYAAMFPTKIRAMVLDGNIDPVAFRRGPRTPFLREHAADAASATFKEFLSLCARVGTRCAFAAGPTPPPAKFAELANRLHRTPLRLPDGSTFGRANLIQSTFSGLYSAQQWSVVAQNLQDLYTRNPTVLTGLTGTPPTADLAPFAHTELPYDNTTEALLGNLCSDTVNARRASRYPRIASKVDAVTPYAGTFATWLSYGCAPWRFRDRDRFTGSFRVRTANPPLIMNARYDPVTPLRNARTMHRLLTGSRLLTTSGYGHTVLGGQGPCDTAYRTRYLVEVVLPAQGAACPAGTLPFT